MLEQLQAILSSAEQRTISRKLALQPSLLTIWQQNNTGTNGKTRTVRQIQDRHRLVSLILDTLADLDERTNESLQMLNEMRHFESLMKRNLLSEAYKLILRLKKRAISMQDRLMMPDILLKEAYLCQQLGKLSNAQALEEELTYWWQVRKLDQDISILGLKSEGQTSTAKLITSLQDLSTSLSNNWPPALKQDGYLMIARTYLALNDADKSHAYFRQAADVSPLDTQSTHKALRQRYRILSEWLLHFPSPTLATTIAQMTSTTPHDEPRAESMRQWVTLLIDCCQGQLVERERFKILTELLPQAQQQTLQIALGQLYNIRAFKQAHQLLLTFPAILHPKDEGLWHIRLLLALNNPDGADIWLNRLIRKRLISNAQYRLLRQDMLMGDQ